MLWLLSNSRVIGKSMVWICSKDSSMSHSSPTASVRNAKHLPVKFLSPSTFCGEKILNRNLSLINFNILPRNYLLISVILLVLASRTEQRLKRRLR
ncbi:hypothetical protein BKA69DRAFT_144921 [Paraphysoderma sedebokerense]|nr:hypothetical protein BKA69DRAFT_144921 [Paraphysoderma sedebokerense]